MDAGGKVGAGKGRQKHRKGTWRKSMYSDMCGGNVWRDCVEEMGECGNVEMCGGNVEECGGNVEECGGRKYGGNVRRRGNVEEM